MSYLLCLSTGPLSAFKAWRIFRQMFVVLSVRIDEFDLVGIDLDAQVPTGWTDDDEALLMDSLESFGEIVS